MEPKAEAQRFYEEIWRTTFGDNDDLITFHGHTTFDPRRAHLLMTLDRNRAPNHVQYLSYLMRYRNQWWRAGYISGAATVGDQRGKGLVQHLIRASHPQMRREGHLCTLLIPAEEWFYHLYRKMGYATLYGKRLTPTLEGKSADRPSGGAWRQYQSWQATLAERYLIVTHSYHQWCALLASLVLENGGIGAIGKTTYYYHRDVEGKKQSVLTILSARESTDKPSDLKAPFGMLRLLHIAELLTWAIELSLLEMDQLALAALYIGPERTIFDLLDEQIPTNSGHYCLLRQHCQLLFALYSGYRFIKPFTPDQLLAALPTLQHTLIYVMIEWPPRTTI